MIYCVGVNIAEFAGNSRYIGIITGIDIIVKGGINAGGRHESGVYAKYAHYRGYLTASTRYSWQYWNSNEKHSKQRRGWWGLYQEISRSVNVALCILWNLEPVNGRPFSRGMDTISLSHITHCFSNASRASHFVLRNQYIAGIMSRIS